MISEIRRRKILVPIFFRGHLARLRSVFRAIQQHPGLELQIMTASRAPYGSFLMNLRHSEPRSLWRAMPWYIRAGLASLAGGASGRDTLERKVLGAGFPVHSRVPLFLDGGTPGVMAKSVGVGLMRIVDELRRLEPNIVLVSGDRFEMMAITIAAAYLNIVIAHHEGGDVSGTIDESVRHAITKFAHLHLTATERSRERVLQMGEDPRFVFNTGSPTIDAFAETDLNPQAGFPQGIDPSLPYLLVLVHPVTTESDLDNQKTVDSMIDALERLQMPTILVGGNSDAYSRIVGPGLAEWFNLRRPSYVYAAKLMSPDGYSRVLAHAACAVGNSSSFIREGAWLGTPAVLVGSRQQGRDRGANAAEVPADAEAIVRSVRKQLAHGRYPRDTRFGEGRAGERIAEILATVSPPIQKKFYDLGL